jgi:peptidoglycan biosynthesis protein MviN/MurJ (putative lipid II flippase)
VSIATAALPDLSKHAAADDHDAMQHQLERPADDADAERAGDIG